jgi:hypothetical protein
VERVGRRRPQVDLSWLRVMTLILSVITPTYVMQASDRRVVVLDDAGQVVDHWDEHNKAVFVAERMTFAYTGHADIAGTDTAEFFQGRLASELGRGAPVEEALDVVGEMSEQYLRSLPSTVDRAHAFVGVGWSAGAKLAKRKPFIIGLSNSFDADGNWLSQPNERFSTSTQALPATELFALHVAGRLGHDATSRLAALLGSHIERSDDPIATAELLTTRSGNARVSMTPLEPG